MRWTYIIIALLLLPSVAAIVDVYQNTYYSVTATSAIEPSPTGLAGFLADINATTAGAAVDVSGTWFLETDTVIIDTLFIDKKTDDPISGANCSLSLFDSTFTELLNNASMPEISIAGISHYTYNASNISALGGATQGKFFGHVSCAEPGKKPVLGEADFEVHKIVSSILSEIAGMRSTLIEMLNRQYDFSQEEIFLVTDAFNSMSGLLDAVESGRMSEQTAEREYLDIKQKLDEGLGKSATAKVTPKASSASFLSSFTSRAKEVSTKTGLYILLFVLLFANIIVVIVKRRKRQFEEMW